MSALATALMVLLSQAPAESLLDASKHNFMAGTPRPPTMDACQFCHVANTLDSAPVLPPAWEPGVKTKDGHAALEARADPSGPPLSMRWAGSTLRCLSCHDATVSSINIVFRPTSVSLKGDEVAADRQRAEDKRSVFLGLPQEWTGRVMGNHPVAVPYPLQLTQSEYRGYSPRSAPLPTKEWHADPRKNGLKLFNDTSGFDVLTGTAGVECASCHDPHGTPNVFFLRLPLARSELCLGCHRK
ncbi:MAG: cytochrome c3 family protein [Myxococcales bacterium]|nr:cytochrome c3 family protein [Myxococcales bacterium]